MDQQDEKLERLEGEVEEARKRLREAERAADEQIERAERLGERAAELKEGGERLRREMNEPTGPLLPPEEDPGPGNG